MRLAVVGKGGSGKSVIAATLARLLGRDGSRVLAADLDVNPGMAISLGVPVTDSGLPLEAVQPAPADIPYGFDIRADLSPEDAVSRYGVDGPDGVRFFQIGNVGRLDHGLQRFVVAIRRILRGFRVPGWHIIGDLEAGTTTPYEGYADFADRALIVIEPTWTSALAARRLAGIFREHGPTPMLIANKVRDSSEANEIKQSAKELELPLIGLIPYDPNVAEADRLGLAPLDHAAKSPAMESLKLATQTLAGLPAQALT